MLVFFYPDFCPVSPPSFDSPSSRPPSSFFSFWSFGAIAKRFWFFVGFFVGGGFFAFPSPTPTLCSSPPLPAWCRVAAPHVWRAVSSTRALLRSLLCCSVVVRRVVPHPTLLLLLVLCGCSWSPLLLCRLSVVAFRCTSVPASCLVVCCCSTSVLCCFCLPRVAVRYAVLFGVVSCPVVVRRVALCGGATPQSGYRSWCVVVFFGALCYGFPVVAVRVLLYCVVVVCVVFEAPRCTA